MDDKGYLSSSLFRKPASGNTVLRYDSAHPAPLKRSIPFAQYLRLSCICKDTSEFKQQARGLQSRLLERSYTRSLLIKAYNNALKQSRDTLLYEKKEPVKDQTVRCIFTYSCQHNKVKEIMSKYWFLLTEDAILLNYVTANPSITYRKCRSVKDTLVRSHFSNNSDMPAVGTTTCGQCPAC